MEKGELFSEGLLGVRSGVCAGSGLEMTDGIVRCGAVDGGLFLCRALWWPVGGVSVSDFVVRRAVSESDMAVQV